MVPIRQKQLLLIRDGSEHVEHAESADFRHELGWGCRLIIFHGTSLTSGYISGKC